ncbi:MAG: CRISPR-associated helicase Cas3' [Nitrososphaeria archaeon]|nr:CRISPR-associated helicase Cas3' [Nitrososphaeria archaeon]
MAKNNWSSRKFIEEVLSLLEKEWSNKNVFIIEAPTGYGKSSISQTISLYSLNEEMKSIIVFPLRTLLEDQYSKFNKLITQSGLLGKRYMHNMGSLYLIKPVTLTTIDTLSLTLFGIPPEDFEKVVKLWSGTSSGSLGHYLFSYSSIIFSNIVLDEVHLLSDSTKSLNFLFLLIEHAIENGQKLILMSATLPSALLKKFEEYRLSFSGIKLKDKLEIIRFTDYRFCDDDFINERKNKKYEITLIGLNVNEKFDKIIEYVKEGVRKGFTKIIIVFNTVEDAITFYTRLNNENIIEKTILLHSRFNENDRVSKHEQFKMLKESDNYVIVSTQVIEAGIDISSNFFITEIAPANSLVQRLGRFLRYDKENLGQVLIWYEADENGCPICYKNRYKVYDYGLTDRTLQVLKSYCEHDSAYKFRWFTTSAKISFHNPESYQKFLDNIYQFSDFEIIGEGIRDLLKIFMNLETLSKKSFDKYLEIEGSFVRDEMQVSVITENIVCNLINQSNEDKIRNLINSIMPISIERLQSLKVKWAIKIEKEKETDNLNLKLIPIETYKLNNSKRLFEFILKNQIIALTVEGEYDSEYGLILR